jgi:hypothetical protein
MSFQLLSGEKLKEQRSYTEMLLENNRVLLKLIREAKSRGLDPVEILERAYKEKIEGAKVNEVG